MKFRVKEKRQGKVLSFKNLFPSIVSDFEMQNDFLLQSIINEWPVIAGELVATHSKPHTIRKRKLVIFADHPVFASEISANKNSIIDRIVEKYGEGIITDIKLEIKKVLL